MLCAAIHLVVRRLNCNCYYHTELRTEQYVILSVPNRRPFLVLPCFIANSHDTVVPAAVLKRAPTALSEVELHAVELPATATTNSTFDRYISSTVGSTSDSILSPKRASTAAAAVTAQPSSYSAGVTPDASVTPDVTGKHLLAGPWAKLQQVCVYTLVQYCLCCVL
jgi:hypothetical protein